MALANFFGKNALAAHHVLGGMLPDTFASLLNDHVVVIAFDDAAAASCEGTITSELAVDMAARLYPRLCVFALGGGPAAALAARLRSRALEINPDIDPVGDPSTATVVVVVGETPFSHDAPQVIYAGSEQWHALISPDAPVGSGGSSNPFGAAAAACFALANVFRAVFRESLEVADADSAFGLSLFDYSRSAAPTRASAAAAGAPSLEGMEIDLGETFLAGVGAIGNASVWGLARLPGLRGSLHLIDEQRVGLSNLQRYVLTSQVDAADSTIKVELAAKTLRTAQEARGESGLLVVPHARRWGAFLKQRADWRLERLMTALDTVQDRLAAQAALPKRMLNAWTQIGDLGVSRHLSFGQAPCAACLYRFRQGGKSEAEQIGENMGFPGAPMFIREMLVAGQPIGASFVREVARRRAVVKPEAIELLLRFASGSLREFYNEAFCGGVILELGGAADGAPVRAEAPMVFQSVLAGIMLAAEVVIDAGSLRTGAEVDRPATRTTIDLLRPLSAVLQPPAGRRTDGLCLCNDPDYLSAYALKYGELTAR